MTKNDLIYNPEISKEIFNLAKKFKNNCQNEDDIIRFCQIYFRNFIFKNLASSNSMLKFNFDTHTENEKKKDYRESAHQSAGTITYYLDHFMPIKEKDRIAAADLLNKLEEFNESAELSEFKQECFKFFELACTSGHEYRHFCQYIDEMNSKNAKPEFDIDLKVLESYERFFSSEDLVSMIEKFIPNFLDEYIKLNNITDMSRYQARLDLNHALYKQLRHEEDARLSGIKLASEFLDSLLNDQNCDDEVRGFIEGCKLVAKLEYQNEKLHGKNLGARYCTDMLFEAIKSTPIEEIKEKMKDATDTLKCQLVNAKLATLRESNLDAVSYYKAIATLGKNYVDYNSARYIYLANADPKTLLNALQDHIEFGFEIINNLNYGNENPKAAIYLTADEVSEYALDLAKKGKYQQVYQIAMATSMFDLEKNKEEQIRKQAIFEKLQNNEELCKLTDTAAKNILHLCKQDLSLLNKEQLQFLNTSLYVFATNKTLYDVELDENVNVFDILNPFKIEEEIEQR